VRTLAHRSEGGSPTGPAAPGRRQRLPCALPCAHVHLVPRVCYRVRMAPPVADVPSLERPRGRLRRPVNLTLAAATVARARAVAGVEGVKLCRLVDRVLAAYLDALPLLPRPRPARRTTAKGGA